MDQSRPLHRGSGCHECRRRKLKCSGTKPSCDRCARSNTACVYDPVEKSKVALLRDELLMLREKVRTLEKTHGLSPGGLDADKGLKRRSPDDGLPVVPRPAPSPPGQWRVSLSTEDQAKLLNQFTAIQHVANEYTGVAPNPHPVAEPYAAKTAAFLLASLFSPTHRYLQADLLECTRHCIEDAIRSADQPVSPHPGTSPTRHSASSPKRSGTSPRLGSPRSPRIVHPLALRPNAALGSGLVLDAIHASSLLAVWMLIQGRLVECQQALFGAAKLAIMSGMHTIRSLDERPSGEPSPAQLSMDKPSHSNIGDERAPNPGDERAPNADSRPLSSGGRLPDSRERPVRHRVGVFWQLVCLDYTAAILMGSPASLPWEDCPAEVRVETVWPDCEATCASISSLFRGSKSSLSLHAKSIVLLERAVRLSAQREPGQTLLKETDAAISNVLEQLPASRSASLHPHTLMLCARVRLHEASAARDHVSQVVWVQSAVAIVRLLDSIDQAEVVARADLLMAYSWIASYMVLLHEQYYVPYLPESEHAVRIGLDLEKLKQLLDAVGARMPVVDTMFKSAINQFHACRTPTSPYASPPSDTPSTPEKISLPKASTPSKSCVSDDVKTEHDELVDDN